MNELDKAWKENCELTDRLNAMKKAEKNKRKQTAPSKIAPKFNPSTLGERMHKMWQELAGLSKMIDEVRADLDVAYNIFEKATYVVDYGNIGEKKNRDTFPNDFFGAIQYFTYISDKFDWAEILMSVNISYSENYINHKRAILRRKENENEQS